MNTLVVLFTEVFFKVLNDPSLTTTFNTLGESIVTLHKQSHDTLESYQICSINLITKSIKWGETYAGDNDSHFQQTPTVSRRFLQAIEAGFQRLDEVVGEEILIKFTVAQ